MDARVSRAILVTPPGAAAIAVVRIVGPRVARFLANHFSRPARPRRTVHADLRDGDRVLDDPVVVVLDDDGRSADINLHGGPWVVESVLNLLRREGFEVIASTGDVMPEDAVDADDPLWRDVLAHLPLARTEQALRVLLAQPAAWASGARSSADDERLWWLLHPPRVAIVGLPNVGKSTLANQLFAQERSITADLPGTTRDWVGEMANIDGLAVVLVDTPGMREASDPIERTAIQRSGAEVQRADLVVLVLDASQPVEAEAQRLIDAYPNAIRVWNKADLAAGAPLEGLSIIATRGVGIDALRSEIRKRFGLEMLDERSAQC
jgi:small GTP-binding protein